MGVGGLLVEGAGEGSGMSAGVQFCQEMFLEKENTAPLLIKTFHCPCPLSKTAASSYLVFDLNFVFILHENALCLLMPLRCCWDRMWVFYVLSFQAGWKELESGFNGIT